MVANSAKSLFLSSSSYLLVGFILACWILNNIRWQNTFASRPTATMNGFLYIICWSKPYNLAPLFDAKPCKALLSILLLLLKKKIQVLLLPCFKGQDLKHLDGDRKILSSKTSHFIFSSVNSKWTFKAKLAKIKANLCSINLIREKLDEQTIFSVITRCQQNHSNESNIFKPLSYAMFYVQKMELKSERLGLGTANPKMTASFAASDGDFWTCSSSGDICRRKNVTWKNNTILI